MISNIPGIHNVQNVLAVCAMSVELGVNISVIKAALASFQGVNRRFSILENFRGIKIFDDYGHHPAEIKATIAAAREISKEKVIAIVQPHRYSRLKALFEEFTSAFNDADIVLITDVYAAGEKKIENINKESLINSLISAGHKDVREYNANHLKKIISSMCRKGDIVVFLGAGDITTKAKSFVKNYLMGTKNAS